MKQLGEIYWEIDHQCREENISMVDESTMLLHAAEEYTEELLKHEERWKSIVFHDIDYLKASAIGRSRMGQKGYSEGADLFLSYIIIEIERYGYDINDIVDPITHELVKTSEKPNNIELPKDIAFPENNDTNDIFEGVEYKYQRTYIQAFNNDADKYTQFFKDCKGKSPIEIVGLLYDNQFFNPNGTIKAVYYVCVVPNMTKENQCIYETFLGYWKSKDQNQKE